MESKNEFNIYSIGIDNTEHVRDIVDMLAYLFHDTIMSIHEDNYEWISKLTKFVTTDHDDIFEISTTREVLIMQPFRSSEERNIY